MQTDDKSLVCYDIQNEVSLGNSSSPPYIGDGLIPRTPLIGRESMKMSISKNIILRAWKKSIGKKSRRSFKNRNTRQI